MKNKPGQNRNYAEKNQNAEANNRREMEAAQEVDWKSADPGERVHLAGKDARKQTPQSGGAVPRKNESGNNGNK